MPSPFPGMDPYLESPEIFPDFHDSLITYLREGLQARLPAPYFAVIGRRVWIEIARRSIGPDVHLIHPGPDVGPKVAQTGQVQAAGSVAVARPVKVRVPHDEFREPFLEIFTRDDRGKRLVTSLEVLGLSNKTPGAQGQSLYRRKQKELLAVQVHVVEIDLLRAGEHTSAVPPEDARAACGPFDYHVSVHPFDDPENFEVYPIRLEQRLPPVDIPLLPGDPPVTLDLQAVLDRCYDAGPYRREIRYGADPIVPPLRPEQDAWARRILAENPA